MIIANFDGKYGREGEIWVTKEHCDKCKSEQEYTICVDQSEGEYNPGKICIDCIREALRGKIDD
jgi:superfamily II helicase